jgi:hypothetical protein
LREAKSSSVYVHEYISGALDWACKEAVCREKRARDEVPGMSGAWDWVLKETPRATSAARWIGGGLLVALGRPFICSRLKKRRKPRVKLVTLKLC